MEKAVEKQIRYPFSGVAPNLIDKFLILGYNQKIIDDTSQNGKVFENFSKYEIIYKNFSEKPSIINEICNDYIKDGLEEDIIIDLIFPNIPSMLLVNKAKMNANALKDMEILIQPRTIIFSINPHDNSGSKKSYNGLGFIFYIQIEHKTNDKIDGTIYVPAAYVILSEYPYFYHFNEICKYIYKQMRKESDEIPLEVLIYNIVKYMESPINKSINLTFIAPVNFKFKDKGNNLSTILEPLYSLSRDKYQIPNFFFHQLSGYPYMDINLSFLFNLIPPEIVLQVFIFSFLEHDIIFYSTNEEHLNMIMYIFSNINYPFNDSIYYWHILSVSLDDFIYGNSPFVGKACSILIGILGEYSPDNETTSKIKEHFVLDIDNKNFFFLYEKESEDSKETILLHNYIKNCIQETNFYSLSTDEETKIRNYFNDGIKLYEAIKKLLEELSRRSQKVTSTNFNEKNEKPGFFHFYDDESEMDCFNANLTLQKAFLSFIESIIKNFVSILFIEQDKKEDNINLNINIKMDDDNNINEEEKVKRSLAAKAGAIFKKKFIDCSKYNSFVVNFCQYHDTIDLFKIPYTFLNEFIYYSHIAVHNDLSEVDVFKIIDQFYGKRKIKSFKDMFNKEAVEESKEKKLKEKKDKKKMKVPEEDYIEKEKDSIIEDNEIQNIYVFNFIEYVEYYKQHLRELINREQSDDKEIFTSVQTRQYKSFRRNGFFLSNKILNIYKNICNNNNDNILKLFKLIKCVKDSDNRNNNTNQMNEINIKDDAQYSFEEIIKNKKLNKLEKDIKIFGAFEFEEITDVIENHFINERCVTSFGLIKFSLLNILAITRGYPNQKISNPKIIETICDFCDNTKSLVRKYMNIFLYIFKQLYEKNIIKNKKEFLQCRNIIAQYFSKSNLLPTEDTIKAFNEKKKGEINNNVKEDKNNEENQVFEKEQNKEEDKFITQNGTFFDQKLFKKQETLMEIFKIIDTVFLGNYTHKAMTHWLTFKDLKTTFKKKGIKDKDYFLPKTPLNLFYSSEKLFKNYINNHFVNEKQYYGELLYDILSLIFYFKLPTNEEEKWTEHYSKSKEVIIDENIAKKKDTKNEKTKKDQEDKDQKSIKISQQISTIIAMLVNLIEVIQKDSKL